MNGTAGIDVNYTAVIDVKCPTVFDVTGGVLRSDEWQSRRR